MKARTMWIAAIAASSLLIATLHRMTREEVASATPAQGSVASRSPSPATRAVVIREGTADGVRSELAELRADVTRLHARQAPREQLSFEEQSARDQRRASAKAAALEKQFSADRRDPGWSAQAEGKLRDAFAAAEIAGGHLEDLSCTATLCRYSVRFESIAQREEGSGSLIMLARWSSRAFGRPSPDDPRRYVAYVSRNPASFPTFDTD